MEIFKSLPLFVLLASALAQYEGYGLEGHGLDQGLQGYEGYHHRPLVHHQILEHHNEDYDVDYHAHPKYSFDYSVKDPHTGDEKEHWETRDGDKVKGSYTLMETDGTKRVVEYEADDKNGFNAVVHRIGHPKVEEEYKIAKPVYEPQYQEEYQSYDGGFVPIEGYEHRH
ncbi:adult-specific cuticular protein ACP-22-like [Pieris napi]|uniref:adult-specific cuticular protein ACP-22-like n=1 Tax=Pieris napi TaxID=78633 RepID=UPI001FB9A63B|nr:adult-specific cuticular protein ACP-22-like [Pieris napi]